MDKMTFLRRKLQAVIAANRLVQRKAQEFNIRAGQEIFKVFSQEEWRGFLSTVLNGAFRIANIQDFGSLRLPALDAGLINLILEANPLKIEVMSQERPVSYTAINKPPQVTLEGELVENLRWLELPDSGIVLPSGRAVEVNLNFGWSVGSVEDADIPGLKTKARDLLNKQQWGAWTQDSRPAIQIPDPTTDNPVIPEIITAQYGTCVVEGTPLIAYGVAAVKNRYYSSDPYFEARWFQNQGEAETAHADSVQKLEAIREEVRMQHELAQVKTEATEAQQSLRATYDAHYYNNELSSELRESLYNRLYASATLSSLDEFRQYVAETNALVAKVEVTLAEIARKKAEEEADLARAVAAGEVLLGFEAWHRRGGMTSNGDGWVIRADGTLRDYDTSDARRHKTDGNRRWERVNRDELALRWSCGHRGDVAGNSKFEVVKLPLNGLTAEQLATVREIEEGLEAPLGAFGFDLEAKKAAERRLQAIHHAAEKILGHTPDFTYYEVAGKDGVPVRDDGRSFRVNWSEPFNEGCDGRAAQVVRAVRVDDGMLEFLAYDKYGQLNISMRFRLLREDELQAEQEPISGDGPSLDDLAAKWGARVKK